MKVSFLWKWKFILEKAASLERADNDTKIYFL